MPSNKLSTDTNNVNQLVYSYSTAMDIYSDRAAGSISARGRIKQFLNLGVGVTEQNPFTNLTS